ncbi:Pepsin A [Psilocybe cubensis]|uniref:Pepsin A n=1 Tax=Psilocybe cubensis TaxID=181762 RepID=A0ACB8GXN7_PSICU|nr:Pepsin A [Psilocybe cubensis]KAH9480354.1 Pepsin A [Psilocybe cubensis]
MFKGFTYAGLISTYVIQYSWILELVALVGAQYLFGHSTTQCSPINPLNMTNERSQRIQIGDGASTISGSVGLGNFIDLMYTVPVQLGQKTFALQLDTGSSDLWVLSENCHLNSCERANGSRYMSFSSVSSGIDVDMHYGDSSTSAYAFGTVAFDKASVAGITMLDQAFAVIDDTTNHILESTAEVSGIFGLSFPIASRIQEEVSAKTGALVQTDHFVEATPASGPILSRLAASGALHHPMFTIESQRTAIDTSGRGALTIGQLPEGIDNSTLTWVPVRLYSPDEGGLIAPSFAPGEIYPYRWEIDIDGVFLDGKRLPDSTIPANGVDSHRVSALIDTGNSVLRGPEDVVSNVLGSVSQAFHRTDEYPVAELPCHIPHSLAFQIGGKMFPIDPRDFISQLDPDNAVACQADNLVPTDPPSIGALFRWSLGTPFFRSNIVAFHFGNLTHPSVDPPRIGILSTVPENANELLQEAIRKAQLNGGNFPNGVEHAPTASAALKPQTTVFTGTEYLGVQSNVW